MAKATKTAVKKSAPEKVALKKAASKTSRTKPEAPYIKYEDKSAGQPEMVVIFENIRKMLEPYDQKRALVLHDEKASQAMLVSHKPAEVDGRKSDVVWFICALVQKGYVGFYCRPPYPAAEMKKQFSETFVKSLKGKGCFHIKNNTPELMADMKKAIKTNYDLFVANGWI